MEVEMRIRGLLLNPVTNTPIVILKDANSDTVLPIWVGIYEANAIALEIEKVSTPRPMTHDLIKNVLTGLDAHVHKIVVTELKEDTFYAVIWMERDGRVISVDSRPSDALALALRVDCPIFVEDEVLKISKKSTNASDPATSEELRKWLEGLNDPFPPPFLNYQFDDAYDEMFESPGVPRSHYQALFRTLLELPGEELRKGPLVPRDDPSKSPVDTQHVKRVLDHDL